MRRGFRVATLEECAAYGRPGLERLKLLPPIAGASGPTLVQSNTATPSGTPSNGTCAYTSNVTAGNLLVMTWGWSNANGTSTISDTLTDTWTTVGPVTNSSIPYSAGISYTVANASGANTVSLSSGGGYSGWRIGIMEWSGVNTFDVAPAGGGTTGNSASLNSGSATTTQPVDLVIGWGISNNGVTSAGSGFTLGQTINSESNEYLVTSSAGSQAATFPTSSSQWLCLMAAFYMSGGAPVVMPSFTPHRMPLGC